MTSEQKQQTLPAKLSRLISRYGVCEFYVEDRGKMVETQIAWSYDPHSVIDFSTTHVIDAAYVEKLERILAAVGPLVEAAYDNIHPCECSMEKLDDRCTNCEQRMTLNTFNAAVTREVGE